MGEPWTYPNRCPICLTRWYEGYEREVDPVKASDGETLCSPECRDEYEAEGGLKPTGGLIEPPPES